MATSDFSIRDALSKEDLTISILFYNAFIDAAWNHNWFEGRQIPQRPITSESDVQSLNKQDRARLLFYECIVASTRLVQQPVRVITSNESGEIVGCAMWMGPKKRMPTGIVGQYKVGFVKLMLQWGLRGMKRADTIFEGEVNRLQKKAFQERSVKTKGLGKPIDAAYLQMIATSKTHQGRGLGSMLVQDGLAMYKDLPVILEATEEGPKKVYLKNGFELVGESWVAKGECDDLGFCGSKAGKMNENGKPIYVMVKW